ncbi:MAG TPA: tail fiber domain-containing protein [Ferruginibacter sp.]|nr:tail fiber domain-containing protein [Ferruginibacter sp.]HMP21723.1 tail fiber domain-containing protein [Ferruginibacter sp.]
MKKIFTCMLTVMSLHAVAQRVGINVTGAAPHTSAMLDVASTNRGLLIPRMTLAQRNAVATPATGLLIYQTDNTAGFYFYNGVAWQGISGGDNLGNHTATQNLILGPNFISRSGTDNTGLQFDEFNGLRYRATNNESVLGDRFRVDHNGGLVALGALGFGTVPQSGAGERMMWYPYKAAFRVGGISGTEWNDASIGFYSTATGFNCIASAFGTFAGGDACRASGVDAFSYGASCTSSGTAGVSMGASCLAGGFTAIAMGYTSRALGQGGVAIGYRVSSTTNYAVGIGHRAVALHTGALVFSDASTTDSTLSTANNQFSARYAGGYRFFSNATRTVGVSVAAGGNSWASISDSSLKERFVPAEHEAFLKNLAQLRLGSWNYIGQNEPSFRHYGPMAQEIFSAYGKDAFGTIGNSTSLNTADMDGIMMILLQGLEKRTAVLQENNKQLMNQLAAISKENDALRDTVSRLAMLEEKMVQLLAKAEPEKNVVTGAE